MAVTSVTAGALSGSDKAATSDRLNDGYPSLLSGSVKTAIRLVPKDWISLVTKLLTPLPMDIRAITAATPMITPNMVSSARSLFAKRLSKAVKKLSEKFILFPAHAMCVSY